MITLPGEPDDPLEQFVKDYNDKKILPERSGLLKSIDKISIHDIKSWGRKALDWKRRQEREVTTSATEQSNAPYQASEGANAQFGRRSGDFWNAPLEQFIKVPRFDIHAAAGAGPVIHSEQVVDVCAFKPEWVQHTLGVAPRDIALISVKGDGMAPTLASGDMVLVDTHRGRVEDDAVYVLRHDDGDLRVKRIQRKMDGTLIVTNDNKEYSEDDVFSPAEAARLNVVGRVVWRGCRM